MRLRKDFRQLIASGIFEYFNMPYELLPNNTKSSVRKAGRIVAIDNCGWTGGVLRIVPKCPIAKLLHEIAHFLVASEEQRFGDSLFYSEGDDRAEEILRTVLGILKSTYF